MDRDTSRGIAAVRRIKRQYNLDGVYGTLAELLEVNESHRTAVEVTAGNSLFHYVVDNDDTATKVLEVLQRERSGRVTFMPLNRLRPKPVKLPQSADAVPILEKIKRSAEHERAFQQVFGKTIVCPNLQVAAQYARSHGVSAITVDGDRSDKKGALTGGFYDPRRSRLEAVKNVAKWRRDHESHKARSDEIRRELDRIDQEITRAVGEAQRVEQKRQQLESSYGPLRAELRAKETLLERQNGDLEGKKRSVEAMDASLKEIGEQLSSFESELASDFKKSLTREEEQRLEQLNASVQALRKQYAEIGTGRSELEARKSVMEVELRENLRPRLDQLKRQELENLEGGGGASSSNVKEKQRELRRIDKTIQAADRKLKETERAGEQAAQQLSELEQGRTEKQRQQEEIARQIERHQKRMERSMAKKALLTEKASECSRNIRDLGVLPEEAFEKYENTPSNSVSRCSLLPCLRILGSCFWFPPGQKRPQDWSKTRKRNLTTDQRGWLGFLYSKIVKRLHKVNESLKKYGHVNKKAFEQYNNFTRQRDTLTKRRAELESSQRSIVDLIDILDQRKDEAIERTFKQVSREFANIFERLVPAGRGRLIIQRKADRRAAAAAAAVAAAHAHAHAQANDGDDSDEDDDDDEDEQEQVRDRRKSVENYTGVGITVSFNSKDDEQQRIQQLSGGQKSKLFFLSSSSQSPSGSGLLELVSWLSLVVPRRSSPPGFFFFVMPPVVPLPPRTPTSQAETNPRNLLPSSLATRSLRTRSRLRHPTV